MTNHKTQNANELLTRCRDYIQRSKIAVTTQPFSPPDVSPVAKILLPDCGIESARADGEDRYGLGWPFVAFTVAKGENERYVDPWFFVAMQLFAVAGCEIRLAPSKTKPGEPKRSYLCYDKKNHSLRRLIADTPPTRDAWQLHPTAKSLADGRSDGHYDYRRVTAKNPSKVRVRKAGYKTRLKGKGRKEAIAFAADNLERGRDTSGLQISPDELKALLNEAFEMADAMHEKMLKRLKGDN